MRCLTIIPVLLLALAACASPAPESPRNLAYEIAADPQEHSGTRIEAARELSEIDRDKLRSELTARLPGGMDKATLDNVELLGVIGDCSTMALLEQLHSPNVSGKMTVALLGSITSIKKRLGIPYVDHFARCWQAFDKLE